MKSKPKQVSVRLHRQHDMDLISLYLTEGFKFQRHLKAALTAYVNGEKYIIPTDGAEVKKGYVRRSILMHLVLDKVENKKEIELLEEMKNGMRNSFLKALFRASLSEIPLAHYKRGDGILITKDEAFIEDEKNRPSEEAYKKSKEAKSKPVKPKSVKKNPENKKVEKNIKTIEPVTKTDKKQNELLNSLQNIANKPKDIPIEENNNDTEEFNDDMFAILESLTH